MGASQEEAHFNPLHGLSQTIWRVTRHASCHGVDIFLCFDRGAHRGSRVFARPIDRQYFPWQRTTRCCGVLSRNVATPRPAGAQTAAEHRVNPIALSASELAARCPSRPGVASGMWYSTGNSFSGLGYQATVPQRIAGCASLQYASFIPTHCGCAGRSQPQTAAVGLTAASALRRLQICLHYQFAFCCRRSQNRFHSHLPHLLVVSEKSHFYEKTLVGSFGLPLSGLPGEARPSPFGQFCAGRPLSV